MKKTHRWPKVKKVKDESSGAVAVINEPTIAEDFDAFLKLDTQSKVFATKASAALILSGVELARLKKKHSVVPGRHSSRTLAGGSWPELVKQYGGISDDTADRRIKLAESAAEQLPILQEVLDGDADFRLLSNVKKAALEKGLKVLTHGKSLRQLMWDFGLTKEPALKGGHHLDKKLIAQWCSEYHPELPAAQCLALPTPALKKEFDRWAVNQALSGRKDYDAEAAIDMAALDVMAGQPARHNGCLISTLADWIERAEHLVRTLKEAKTKRKSSS